MIIVNYLGSLTTRKENLGMLSTTKKKTSNNKLIMQSFDKLRLTEKNAEKVNNLHKNSYYTAIKAVIGQVGKQLYERLLPGF